MSLIFKTEYGKLYNGCSHELIDSWLKESDKNQNLFSLCLTDPPYGIDENSGKVKSRVKLAKPKDYGEFNWDKDKISLAHLNIVRKSAENQIIFGGNYYADWLPASSSWIVWDKDNSGDFADCELAWTSHKRAVRKFKYRWNGMLQQDMKNKEQRYHPTQKPLRLFEWIIENYYESGSVIDPFAGSGTTAIICERLKIPWVCIEIENSYCEKIINRLSNLQQTLF